MDGKHLNRFLRNIVMKLRLYLMPRKWRLRMIDLYVALIINGRRTIDNVPARYKDAVLADLNALGLDGYGNPLGE